MLLFATILNFITAYLIASLSAEILVIFVAFFALVILNIEILSLFKAISDVGIVALSGLFLVFFGIIFKYKKTNFLKFSFDFNRFKNALFLDKALLVLFAAFLFMLFIP